MRIARQSVALGQFVALMFGAFVFMARDAQSQTASLLPEQIEPTESSSPLQSYLPSKRTQLQIGLPTTLSTTANQLIVQPKVQTGTAVELVDPLEPNWLNSHRPSAELSGEQPIGFSQEGLPAPMSSMASPLEQVPYSRPSVVVESAPPLFDGMLESAPANAVRRRSVFSGHGQGNGPGLGHERLAFSLFDIDPAQPFNNFRIRAVLASRLRTPDRAEYFWSKAGGGKGPALGESTINYQEARMRMELGSKKFSTAFEVPFRSTDPQFNKNHAGLGDMQLIVKTVLLDGKQWMLTQYFGTHFATGNAAAGLGTGHVSLEPGILFRNELQDDTWMHGELKFLFPLGADPVHAGQVLKFATGFNHVWIESDHDAWIPSLELVAFSVLNGMATDSFGRLRPIDHDSIFYLTPGLRYAVDNKGDFGLFEVGSAVSLAVSQTRFTDATWNFEMRWSW